jgi:SAM-dependent methyltransferase
MNTELIGRLLGHGSRIPVLRSVLTRLHRLAHWNEPWMRVHPFDTAYGTTTSGRLPAWLLRSGNAADAHATAYAGCQPSCLRHALAVIPDPEDHSFVDLGCGKGRALVIASELPFRRILGIELAPGLVVDARRNARIVKGRYPLRTPIEVIEGDATTAVFPDGDLVVFLYHSFGPELIGRMLSRVTDAVAAVDRTIFLIYENPVYGALVDSNAAFARWHCKTVPCDPSDVGFAPDDEDTVVVWRVGPTAPTAPATDAATPIVVTKPGWRAALETDMPN